MFYGLLSGILAGLDTVLLGVTLTMVPFLVTGEAIFLAPFVSTFLHDGFSSIWIAIYMITKNQLEDALRAINTRSGRCIIIAALFSGPVGMTGYLLAIKYIGPAYTAIISSLFPAVGAVLAFVFLKEKMKPLAILGLCLSITGIVILGYGPIGTVTDFKLGFVWALIAVFGWASEAVICSYGMKGGEISPEQSLQLRQLTSTVVNGFLVLPLLGGIKFTVGILSTNVAILIFVTALFATMGSMFYYKGINKIGATKAMSLNITYSAWAIVFGIILLGNSIDIKSIICCAFIMFGSIMAAAN